MTFILFFSGRLLLESVRLSNVHPYRRSIALPYVDGETFIRMGDALWILTRLSHGHDIIRNSLTRHCAVLLDLLMEKTKSFSALHLSYRILPNGYFTMVDEALLLEHSNEIATEILEADHTIALFHHRKIHAMERQKATRHGHTIQFLDQEFKMLGKLLVARAVAHIPVAIGIAIQVCKRR